MIYLSTQQSEIKLYVFIQTGNTFIITFVSSSSHSGSYNKNNIYNRVTGFYCQNSFTTSLCVAELEFISTHGNHLSLACQKTNKNSFAQNLYIFVLSCKLKGSPNGECIDYWLFITSLAISRLIVILIKWIWYLKSKMYETLQIFLPFKLDNQRDNFVKQAK